MIANEQIKKLMKLEFGFDSCTGDNEFSIGLKSVLNVTNVEDFYYKQKQLTPKLFDDLRNADTIDNIHISKGVHWSVTQCTASCICNITYKNGEKEQLPFLFQVMLIDGEKSFCSENFDLVATWHSDFVVLEKESLNDTVLIQRLCNSIIDKTKHISYYPQSLEYDRYKKDEISDAEIIGIPEIQYCAKEPKMSGFYEKFDLETREIYYDNYGGVYFKWYYSREQDWLCNKYELDEISDSFGDDPQEFQLAKDVLLEGCGFLNYYQFGVFLGEYSMELSDMEEHKQETQRAKIEEPIKAVKKPVIIQQESKSKETHKSKTNITKLVFAAIAITGIMLLIVYFLGKM